MIIRIKLFKMWYHCFLLIFINQLNGQTTNDCGLINKCFTLKKDCTNSNCEIIFKWRDNGNDKTDFEISAYIPNLKNNWLAIGFSKDNDMGDDDVVVCNTNYKIEHFYNPNPEGTQPKYLNAFDASIGLSNTYVLISNNWLICQFTRMISMPTQTNYFDVNNPYYILAAYGNLNSFGAMEQHSYAEASSTVISLRFTPLIPLQSSTFINTTLSTVLSTPQTNQGNNPTNSDCDISYKCFVSPPNCQDSTCKFIFKWQNNGVDKTNFIISGNIGTISNNWLAIGFSNDALMGNDDLIVCKSTNIIQHYRNTGGYVAPSLLNSNDPFIGISNSVVSNNNGWLTCSFTRNINLSTQPNYYDLNNQYYVLAAYGDLNPNGDLNYHGSNRIPSSVALSFKFTPLVNPTLATTSSQSITTLSQLSTVTTVAQITTQTTDSVNTNIATTSNCDINYKCFVSPNNCQDSLCTFIYKWKSNINDPTLTDFIISGKIGTISNNWLAIGFSNDASMGNDDLIVCKSTNIIQHYRNTGGYVAPSLLNANDPFIGISNAVVYNNNGWLICSFSRKISIPTQTNYYDLNNQYYVLAAYGNLDNNGIDLAQHSQRAASQIMYSFQYPVSGFVSTAATNEQTLSMTTTASSPVQNSIADSSDCTVTKGCFLFPSNCQGSSCKYIYKYASDANYTYFDLIANVGSISKPWLAIGFSTDQTMGNDGVCMCVSSGFIEQRYNSVKAPPGLLDNNNPSIGISNAQVTLSNGWLKCSFARLKIINNTNNYFNLNNNFYILAAFGTYSSARASFTGSLSMHVDKTYSSSSVNFNSFSAVSGDNDELPKIKSHACLMIFAWMILASTGIIIARYYKFLLPKTKICGVQFWFVIHRPVMVCVPFITTAAFIIILSNLKWKWVEIENKIMFSHSIFGILTIALAWIQPLIAIFRCDKDTKNRYIFDFFHRLFGMTALICSIVAIFLGTFTTDLDLGDYGWGIILGWTIWLILFMLVNELIEMRSAGHKKARQSNYNNQNNFDAIYENSEMIQRNLKKDQYTEETTKQFLLATHVIVTLGFSIALIIIIGLSS